MQNKIGGAAKLCHSIWPFSFLKINKKTEVKVHKSVTPPPVSYGSESDLHRENWKVNCK